MIDSVRIADVYILTMGYGFSSTRRVWEYFLRTMDPRAWEEFQKRIGPEIRKVIGNRLGRWRAAFPVDDFEQETYLKLIDNDYKHLRAFTWIDDDAIFRYVRAIAANVVFDFLRKNRHTSVLNSEALDLIRELGSHVHEDPYLEALIDEIDKCLQTWAHEGNFERDRAIFWFYYRWGYSAKQIANLPTINLTPRQVENNLQKLRLRVRNKLGERGKGSSPE